MRFQKALSLALIATSLYSVPAFAQNDVVRANAISRGKNESQLIAVANKTKQENQETNCSAKSKSTKKKAKKNEPTVGMPLAEKYLETGELSAGETALKARLSEAADDDQARFGLGLTQLLHGLSDFAGNLYVYGVKKPHIEEIPFLRIGIAENPQPKKIGYAKFREIIAGLLKSFRDCDATLADIKDDDVKLPIHFGLIKLDLNNDGKVSDAESLWKLYAKISHNAQMTEDTAKAFYINLDRGDVHWLRGYTHLLSSLLEMYLAYDSQKTFDSTAHLVFNNVDSPYKFLAQERPGKHSRHFNRETSEIIDWIALVHLINWKLEDPKRMETALHDLEEVVAQSRISWKFIMAETDDDREWLPNPNQTGVLPHMRVTEEMVISWGRVMDEAEKVLKGDKLIPFWRGSDTGVGINLRKVFLQPGDFDLVEWIQGPPAAPYLEHGPLSTGGTWREMMRDFGGSFPGYAFWFN